MERKILKKSSLFLSLSFLVNSLFYPLLAEAELSIATLGGLADHTTEVRGDAIFNYSNVDGFYFQYPTDINTKDFATGLLLRYLFPKTSLLTLGVETGYVYLDTDKTRLRSDNVPIDPRAAFNVENFTTQSKGLILLNLVARFKLASNLIFNVFAGPAWLDTKYNAYDFADDVSRSVGSIYQQTVDTGAEADWYFAEHWSAGMRFDYIYDTRFRVISTIGALGGPQVYPTIAKSNSTLVSLTLRYCLPRT